MNTLKAFSFYKSYYEALVDLDDESAKEIIFAMMKYVFEDEEPKLTGINKTIWKLIEPTLLKSKNKSNKGSGAPKGNQNARKYAKDEELNYKKHFEEIKVNETKNRESIENLFLEYMYIREKNNYTISDSVIKRLIKKLNECSKNDEDTKEMLLQAINGSWKDFYELSKKTKVEEGTIYETI